MDEEKKKMKGVVKFFGSTWGFLIAKIEGKEVDIFCHMSDILADDGEYRKLEQGKNVKFEIEETAKGLQARNIERLE